MRVLVIGASGRSGKLVLDELQHRGISLSTSCQYEVKSAKKLSGHQITVLVRDPAALEGYQVDIVKGMKAKVVPRSYPD